MLGLLAKNCKTVKYLDVSSTKSGRFLKLSYVIQIVVHIRCTIEQGIILGLVIDSIALSVRLNKQLTTLKTK